MPLKINICGDEKIKQVSPLVKNLKFEVGDKIQNFDVSKLFVTSDPENCPIAKYQISATTKGYRLSLENTKIASLRENKLSVNFAAKADFVFYIGAKTVSGASAYQKFYVKITEKVDETAEVVETSTAGKTDFERFIARATTNNAPVKKPEPVVPKAPVIEEVNNSSLPIREPEKAKPTLPVKEKPELNDTSAAVEAPVEKAAAVVKKLPQEDFRR